MKKTRLISFIIAVLMLATMIPMFAITSSAAAQPDISAAPKVLPDNTVVTRAEMLADWGEHVTATEGTSTIEDGWHVINTSDNQSWTNVWLNNKNWRGAKGMMFYVECAGTNADFIIKILGGGSRLRSAGDGGTVQYWTSPTVWGQTCKPNTNTAYYFDSTANTWKPFSVSTGAYYLTSPGGSGWYYVPFTSFTCFGGSAQGYAVNDPMAGMNFVEACSVFESQNIGKITIQSHKIGDKYGDVYMVYGDVPGMTEKNATEADFFPNMKYQSSEGNAVGAVTDGALTVSAMAANTATDSARRVWVNNNGTKVDLKGASGLKFYIDTTKLDAGAAVNLRIRLQTPTGPKDAKNFVYAQGATIGYMESATTSLMQYTMRSSGSTAYYYDAEGNAKALHPLDGVHNNAHGDLLDALPAGYKGYVYIPMDSFWLSAGGSYGGDISVPFDKAVAAGYSVIQAFTVCHAVTGTTASDEVTYSDFTLVYEDTKLDNVSVTIKNDLDMNVYAAAQDGATDVKATFVNEAGEARTVAGVKQDNGLYKMAYTGILPQNMVDDFDITVSATVNGNVATYTLSDYSVRDYLTALLAETEDANLRKLVVEMMNYGAAAQTYSAYKADDLANKDLSDSDKALAAGDVSAESITSVKAISGTAADGYKWVSTNLRLANRIALKIGVTAPAGTKVSVKVGSAEAQLVEITDGYAIFDNIGADQLDDVITLSFVNGDATVGETMTYSINDYIKEELVNANATAITKALVKALYNFGVIANAYSAA